MKKLLLLVALCVSGRTSQVVPPYQLSTFGDPVAGTASWTPCRSVWL